MEIKAKKKRTKNEERRIYKQASGKMTLDEMIKDLPSQCDIGRKQSPKGYSMCWKGYKLNVAISDNCVPIAALVTSASLHDSQVAIPLNIKASRVVKNFYDLMDAAYCHEEIKEHSRSLDHVPLIDYLPNTKKMKEEKQKEARRRNILGFKTAEEIRYQERKKAERFNALFADNYVGRRVRLRGHLKVSCHVMFSLLALTGSLLIKLIN